MSNSSEGNTLYPLGYFSLWVKLFPELSENIVFDILLTETLDGVASIYTIVYIWDTRYQARVPCTSCILAAG